MSYAKLRSKPKGAPESVVGADAIIELEVGGPEGAQRKAALFQAKNSSRNDGRLPEQCAKMSTWREAAFVIHYSPKGYFAYSIDECLAAGGSIAEVNNITPLSSWIVDTFIRCRVGHQWLHYDIDQRRLYWVPVGAEDDYGESRWVWANFQPKHRINIRVTPPNWRLAGAVQVRHDEIPKRRLTYSARDLLGLGAEFTLKELRKRVRELHRAYHSDRNHHLKDDVKALLNARFAEVTAAAELLKGEAIAETHRSKPVRQHEPAVLEEPSPDALETVTPRKNDRIRVRRRRGRTH